MSFGSKLRQARQARSWPQSYLAEKCGVTVQAVSQWENGKTVPTYGRLNEIANLLGVDAAWLADLFPDADNGDVPPSPNRKAFGDRIPIVGLEDAISFLPSAAQSRSVPTPLGYVETLTPFHETCFAVRVSETDILKPLQPNDLLIFEVGLTAVEGDIVIFNGILPGGILSDITYGEVTYLGDDDDEGRLRISALDETHRIAEMQDNAAWAPYMIVGVAIELRRERKQPRPRWY